MSDLRYIKDFPVKGVNFIDISPKLTDPNDFNNIIDEMCKYIPEDVDYIIAPESRGYIFGAAIASRLHKGLVPIRKPGKLPEDLVITVDYEKEYGKDRLCLPKNSDYTGKKFYFVDDVLATGGTLHGAQELIKMVNGNYAGGVVYINIAFLNNDTINCVEKEVS